MLKKYLDEKQIDYNVKYADEDPNLAQELFQKSNQLGVPFTIIQQDDGTEVSILGFDKPKIDSALNIK